MWSVMQVKNMIINSKELLNLPKLEKRENAQEPDLNK